ncbi:MAG TPA: IS1595 family transposase [Methanoregulaceae archaeon]|nr:IS1595 family transposase [Methanoregulaceae archaeon]HQJ87950.1 IS1595 family transposase [Methanoregulaceae archaeon]
MPLYLTRDQWKAIITWFFLEWSSEKIAQRTGIERKRVLRALTWIRSVLLHDVPEIFSGTVEVDETYVGDHWKNKRKVLRDTGTQRGRGTRKQPVFGIFCRNGQVWAEIVENVDAATLLSLISSKVTVGSVVCSDTWRAYTGLAAKGFVHRLVNHGDREYSDGRRNHINGLEGFWGYLKRKLAAKGYIRRDKLFLYLGEYVWRYNHRKKSDKLEKEVRG